MKIEVDSYVIDRNEIERRIKESVESHHIPNVYYGDEMRDGDEILSIEQIRELVVEQRRLISKLEAQWFLIEKPIISVRPIIGPAIMFFKKAFRKLTRWIFRMYAEQQSDYNHQVLFTLQEFQKTQESLIRYLENEEKMLSNQEENDAN